MDEANFNTQNCYFFSEYYACDCNCIAVSFDFHCLTSNNDGAFKIERSEMMISVNVLLSFLYYFTTKENLTRGGKPPFLI